MALMLMSKAFQPNEAARELAQDIFHANDDEDLNDQQFAGLIHVAPSVVAELRAVAESRPSDGSGPGVLRFAYLPVSWWAHFVTRRAVRFGLRIVSDLQIDRLIHKLDQIQVKMLKIEAHQERQKETA